MNPYHCISLGAGVQSTVLALLAERELLPGYPKPQAAIFADTGWEPRQVYEHLAWLETQLSYPVIRTRRPGITLREATRQGRRHDGVAGFADIPHFIRGNGPTVISNRQCTDRYKIEPIRKAVRELAGLPRNPAPGSVHQWLGISTDEIHRMKESRVQFIINRHPLVDIGWSRQDCGNWFAAEYPGRTLAKSACLGCPFHSDRHWVELYRAGGDEWRDTAEIDRAIARPDWPGRAGIAGAPGLHRKGPLDVVIPELDRRLRAQPALPGLDRDGFGNECEGHCGL